MSERLRVAVVGGGIGVSHIKAYVQLPEMFELVAICDIDTAKAERISQEFGIPRVVADFSELCRMDDIDVIDICTPPHLHYPQALEVLAAGKHAICEKPLVGSLKQADELAIAEKQSGRRLMPIFQYRFGHGLQKLKFLIQEGLAGTTYLSTVETAWRRRAAYYDVPWRGKWATELGGAVLGHAIHTHDMLCYVLGPVKQVFARTNTRVNPIEVEDCASASLLMADGSLASLSVTLGSSEEISRHRFCFSNFVAESNLRPYTNSGDPWRFIGDTPELSEQIEKTLERFQPLPEGHAGQFYRFHQAITQGGELPVTIADARASLELVTAIYYSSQTNQPVDLPIGTDHPKYESWLP